MTEKQAKALREALDKGIANGEIAVPVYEKDGKAIANNIEATVRDVTGQYGPYKVVDLENIDGKSYRNIRLHSSSAISDPGEATVSVAHFKARADVPAHINVKPGTKKIFCY